MNSRKRARSLFQNSQNSEENLTIKNESKHNLMTSCRRVGLNRKKNKSFNTLQTYSGTINKNSVVKENLKNIPAETDVSATSSDCITSEENVLLAKQLTNKCNDVLDNAKPNNRNLEISYSKCKVKNDESESKDITPTKISLNSILESSSTPNSTSLNTHNTKKLLNSHENKSKPVKNITIPISINLTRCDLNALKLKLLSPKNSKLNVSVENLTYNKGNSTTSENSQITDHNLCVENAKCEINNVNSNTDTTTIEENIADKQIEVGENPSSRTSNENVSIQNNYLEEHSDGSDFYSYVVRRKKKKVLTNKQRNISKPSPAKQKENLGKRTSANNIPYSDSDDDFVATLVRRDRKSTVKSENSQNSEKNEKLKKRKLKINKPPEGEIVKTGHIRLSENKSYTIIHRDNYVSYVKSFDNDVNFKITESDDNQQFPVRNTINPPKKTMIVERKDYITKRRNSLVNNIELLMEMPSVFTDLDDADMTSVKSSNIPIEESKVINEEKKITNEENKVTNNKKNFNKISLIKTLKLQSKETEKNIHKNSSATLEQVFVNEKKQSGFQSEIISTTSEITSINSTFIQNIEEITTDANIDKITTDANVDEIITDANIDEITTDANTSTSKTIILKSISRSRNNKPSAPPTKPNKIVAEIIEEFNTDSSENEESSDLPESDDDNVSTSSQNSDTISKLQLLNRELHDMTVKQLSDELSSLENSIKKKEERLQSLERISVYKETHNLEQLREVTLQIKRGCQNALVDLVLSLKEQSNAEFTMATLLEYMKLPNELVGYNEQEDKFI